MTTFQLGEERYTSAGNIFRLEEYDGRNRVGVRRVGIVGDDRPATDLWDFDTLFRWDYCQWDSLPIVGQVSDDPTFGIFIPQAAQ